MLAPLPPLPSQFDLSVCKFRRDGLPSSTRLFSRGLAHHLWKVPTDKLCHGAKVPPAASPIVPWRLPPRSAKQRQPRRVNFGRFLNDLRYRTFANYRERHPGRAKDAAERNYREGWQGTDRGKSPSTQAGEFVREQIDKIRQGKHGARSTAKPSPLECRKHDTQEPSSTAENGEVLTTGLEKAPNGPTRTVKVPAKPGGPPRFASRVESS